MRHMAMTEQSAPETSPPRAAGDVPRERRCLRCSTVFWSEGFGERICRRCKGLKAWQSALSGPVSSRRR